jgi:hypothetical protein
MCEPPCAYARACAISSALACGKARAERRHDRRVPGSIDDGLMRQDGKGTDGTRRAEKRSN